MSDVFLVPGVRTPFVKAGGAYLGFNAIQLSTAVVEAMAKKATPDLLVWGQVIPDATVTNIARELVFDAKLSPEIPAFSTVLACSTSFMGTVEAAGMVGHGRIHLALVGGVETMSHVPLALKSSFADGVFAQFAKNPAGALEMLQKVTPADFDLPVNGWANKQSGRSMGQHTEDTAKHFAIPRADQDMRAFKSHQAAIAGQDSGFFADLVIPFGGVDHDTIPRRDSTLEKLATLRPAFDHEHGTLTAGNSSPNTDGAASIWVADAEGLKRLGNPAAVKFADWEIAAMDYHEEGILMAPARAIPRLLARNKLSFKDIDVWNIHEAFAAQVLANVKAASDPAYRREKAGVDFDLGEFPWERLNLHGGSLAIGHPFAATGARILSQAVKELSAMPKGTRGIVSICADGGHGTVGLIERV
ncbi:MAG: acetyl-CoA C-acyltransferase [Proteobacteria bacterium]|nr:acetyl-CoA C-acyltransferase [Pseudomonadota bacterium]